MESEFAGIACRARVFIFERGGAVVYLDRGQVQALSWLPSAAQELREHILHWCDRFARLDASPAGVEVGHG